MKYFCYLLLFCLPAAGCKKFLDTKPDQKLSMPTTLADIEAFLNNDSQLNGTYPGAGESFTDNIFIWDQQVNALPDLLGRQYYTWDPHLDHNLPWNLGYNKIYIANNALHFLDRIQPKTAEQEKWKLLKARAHFFRSMVFYFLAEIYTLPYNPAKAKDRKGLPLKQKIEMNEPVFRSSQFDTYQFMEQDLLQALPHLPVTPAFKTQPTKPAAFAQLARLALVRQEWQKAELYADSAIALFPGLLDYNTLNPGLAAPFIRFNAEVIFHATFGSWNHLHPMFSRIDSNLIKSFQVNDLRLNLFFTPVTGGGYAFKGNYTGVSNEVTFSGITSAEVYLIRAEARARQNKTQLAMADLNTLLAKRFKTGTFTPLAASGASEAMEKILMERRKEMILRSGARWTDLRRLNEEGIYITTPRRVVLGQVYELPPGDKRYAKLIPFNVIELSGMQQNER